MRSTGVLGTCARVLSVEVLSQITPTLQTRPGARRRERLAVWHRSGLHVAPRRASSTSYFAKSLRPLSAAFGRFRPSVPRPQSRGARTPQFHVQCALAPDTPLADSSRQLATGPLPTAPRTPQTQCPQTGDRVVCAVSDGVTGPRTAPPGVTRSVARCVRSPVMCVWSVCGAAGCRPCVGI